MHRDHQEIAPFTWQMRYDFAGSTAEFLERAVHLAITQRELVQRTIQVLTDIRLLPEGADQFESELATLSEANEAMQMPILGKTDEGRVVPVGLRHIRPRLHRPFVIQTGAFAARAKGHRFNVIFRVEQPAGEQNSAGFDLDREIDTDAYGHR